MSKLYMNKFIYEYNYEILASKILRVVGDLFLSFFCYFFVLCVFFFIFLSFLFCGAIFCFFLLFVKLFLVIC